MINFKDIEIREAKEGDQPLINDFFDAMGGESRALFNRRDFNRRGVLKFCARPDKTRRYWLALLDGIMIGYVFFLDFNSSIPALGIAIRDEYHGMHIGRWLIGFAKERIKEARKGGIQLTTHLANIRAQALYEAEGCVCLGQCKNGAELFYLFRFYD